MLRKILKFVVFTVGLIVVLLLALYFIFNQSLPKGVAGPEADALARKILQAINYPHWQETEVVTWTFEFRNHHYVWDKKRHFTEVKWNDYRVLLDINRRKGLVWEAGTPVQGEEKEDLLVTAWEYWVNDSFWLNAPSKVFDPGTSRRIVRQEDGSSGLLITYDTGGVTPGDSYLWLTDETGLPKAWKLWVKIIPLGGLTFSWDKWITTESGAKIATVHDSALFGIPITNVKTARRFNDMFPGSDPFSPLLNL